MLPAMLTSTLLLLTVLAAVGTGSHDEGCIVGSADPSTYNTVDLTAAGGSLYYLEERGNPLGTHPPVPFTGFALPGGQGTWLYEEANGVPGMQRGGIGITGACLFPPPGGLPCLIIDEDPINDPTCGHGPDRIIF